MSYSIYAPLTHCISIYVHLFFDIIERKKGSYIRVLCATAFLIMRVFVLLLLLVSFSSLAQKSPIGTYQDYFGTRLEIRSDSTFLHTYKFHLYSSWTKGIWYTQKDTVHFSMTPVWDTVRLEGRYASKDTLLLSVDSLPSREPHSFYFDTLRGYGQKYYDYSKKLIFDDKRLYQIDSKGKPVRNKVKSYGRRKKVPTWLYRTL